MFASLDEQKVRSYCCALECKDGILVFDAYGVVIVTLVNVIFTIQIHYNGDDGSALILVECMERCRVDSGQTDRMFCLYYCMRA